jgi:hypothetical protein
MLFDRGVMDPVSLLSDWGQMVDKGHIRIRVFRPSRDNTTRKYRRPVAFIFRLSRPRFPPQDELGPVLEPDKLVSYANV